ncbi:MAG: polyphosphate kinase 2 [Dehalococcoidia bacterium]
MPGTKRAYKRTLGELQIELVKLQRHMIANGAKVLVLVEGRDAAGKDGTIKRVVEHLSPRETRVVALGIPSDRDRSNWYFQRWVSHLPASGEFVLFNRSWYNRAGVERVMGFCTEAEYHEFMESVPTFEHLLLRSGIQLFKYYLDITRDEQQQRLEARRTDPLTQWKLSPVDAQASALWDDYSRARDEMLKRTHTLIAPWHVVSADHKRATRINVIRDLLSHLDYRDKDERLLAVDPDVVFGYEDGAATVKIAP